MKNITIEKHFLNAAITEATRSEIERIAPGHSKAFVADFGSRQTMKPAQLFDIGAGRIADMDAIGRFVRKGQSVAIKTNSSFDMPIEMAANTNPHLLKRVIQHCVDASASRVVVFDHAIEHWQRCYDASGLTEAARDTGALVAPSEVERDYHLHRIGEQARRLIKGRIATSIVYGCYMNEVERIASFFLLLGNKPSL